MKGDTLLERVVSDLISRLETNGGKEEVYTKKGVFICLDDVKKRTAGVYDFSALLSTEECSICIDVKKSKIKEYSTVSSCNTTKVLEKIIA